MMEETRITSVIWGSVLMSLLRAFLARFLSLMTAFRAAFSAADAREFIPWGMLLRLWSVRAVEDGGWKVVVRDQTRRATRAWAEARVMCLYLPSLHSRLVLLYDDAGFCYTSL